MSNPNNTQSSSNLRYILGALFVLAIIGAVGVIMVFLYFYNLPTRLVATAASERKAKLSEVNAKQSEIINTYAWVDQPNGVLRIPVERAMVLGVEKLTKAKNAEAKNSLGDVKLDSSKN